MLQLQQKNIRMRAERRGALQPCKAQRKHKSNFEGDAFSAAGGNGQI